MASAGGDIDFDFFGSPRDESAKNGKKDKVGIRGYSSSDSETGNYHGMPDQKRNSKKTIRATIPTSSDVYSGSSSESDSEANDLRAKLASNSKVVKRPNSSVHKSSNRKSDASGKNNMKHGKKTAHQNTKHRSKSDSSEESTHSESQHSHNSDSSSSFTDSSDSDKDSDITDVSPMGSPRPKKHVEIGGATTFGAGKPPMPYERPRSGRSSRLSNHDSSRSNPNSFSNLLDGNSDTMNLKLLMRAIMEMEGKGANRPTSAKSTSSTASAFHQRPTSAKKNYSFDNMRVRDIDKENMRLMQNIMKQNSKKQKQTKKPREAPVTVARRLTPSAVNRIREQKRIEKENQAMLKRLEHARATKTLKRDNLLDEFNTSTLFGVPMSIVHPQMPRPKSATRSIYGAPDRGENHSMSSRSDISYKSYHYDDSARPTSAKFRPVSAGRNGPGTRPASASPAMRPQSGKRPKSAKRPTSAPRKAWEDGW